MRPGADAPAAPQRPGQAPRLGRPSRHALALAALALVLTALHLWLADAGLQRSALGASAAPAMQRIEVAFVRELAPAAPLPARAAPAPAPRAIAPAPAAAAASAPAAAVEPEPEPAVPTVAADATPVGPVEPLEPLDAMEKSSTPSPLDRTAAAPPGAEQPALADAAVAASATGAAAAASAADAFAPGDEWPLSTRLDFTLTGNFQGPVEGVAQVEWLRQGARYQVHLSLSIGPSFAPLATRRLSSEGRITADGLVPLRYEEETRTLWREPRRVAITFGGERLVLGGGRELPQPRGVQDSASQFVHLTWLFTMQPQRLRAGEVVELPLALPRRLDLWRYEVVGAETLTTPMGELPVMHVRPQRVAAPGGELTAEFWLAPTLQYLPVRFLIRQSEQTWVDLRLQRLPQQAAPATPGLSRR